MVAQKRRPTGSGCTVRMGPQGRIVIPAPLRGEMELRDGDMLSVSLEDGRLVLERRSTLLERIQSRFRATVPRDRSLVDELLAERRQEAAREEG